MEGLVYLALALFGIKPLCGKGPARNKSFANLKLEKVKGAAE